MIVAFIRYDCTLPSKGNQAGSYLVPIKVVIPTTKHTLTAADSARKHCGKKSAVCVELPTSKAFQHVVHYQTNK